MRLSFAAFVASAVVATASAGDMMQYPATASASTMGGSSMMSSTAETMPSSSSSSSTVMSQDAGIPMMSGSPMSGSQSMSYPDVSSTELLTEASVCGSRGMSAISNTAGLGAREMTLGQAGLSVSFQLSPDGNVLYADLNSPSKPFSAAAMRIYQPGTLEPADFTARSINCGDGMGRIAHANFDSKIDMTGLFRPANGASIMDTLPLEMDFTVLFPLENGNTIAYAFQPLTISAASIDGSMSQDFGSSSGGAQPISMGSGSGSSQSINMGTAGGVPQPISMGSGGTQQGFQSSTGTGMGFPSNSGGSSNLSIVGPAPIIDLGRADGTLPGSGAADARNSAPSCQLEVSLSCTLASTGQDCRSNAPRSDNCADTAQYTIEVCNTAGIAIREFEDANFDFLGQVESFVNDLPSTLQPGGACATVTRTRPIDACAFRLVNALTYVRALPSGTGNSCRDTQESVFSTALAVRPAPILAPAEPLVPQVSTVRATTCDVDVNVNCMVGSQPCSALQPRTTNCMETATYEIQICNTGGNGLMIDEADFGFMGSTQDMGAGMVTVDPGSCTQAVQTGSFDACQTQIIPAFASVIAVSPGGTPCLDRAESIFQTQGAPIPAPAPLVQARSAQACDVTVEMDCRGSSGIACGSIQPRTGTDCAELLTYSFNVCNTGTVEMIPIIADFDFGGTPISYVNDVNTRPLAPRECVTATETRTIDVCQSVTASASTFVRGQPQAGSSCDSQTRSDFSLVISRVTAPAPPAPAPGRSFLDFWSLGTQGVQLTAPPPPPPVPVPPQQIIVQQPQPQVVVQQPQPQVVVQQPQPQIVVQQPEPQIIVQRADPIYIQQQPQRIFGSNSVPVFGGGGSNPSGPCRFAGKSKGKGNRGYYGNCGCSGKSKSKGNRRGNCGKSKGGKGGKSGRGRTSSMNYEALASGSASSTSRLGIVFFGSFALSFVSYFF